ncbi:peptide N-acetyl-beta-D-glucosaminyl asparaginase amidase A-domain-containing protein [Zalerion maritima]|uniref:Peptide N-acetyl-beta-D-glucosaminyl asparaginase amidase A-domain-containing protein n=1 Tax=Zalerion maritima TaxID=339359 RepID=A0AAD5RQA1_9PEZI|nr:peptide N-acetyl-beta-D-glucosaminyl asparaginase amidase A-domain-containing protein [Zalerion maritima]
MSEDALKVGRRKWLSGRLVLLVVPSLLLISTLAIWFIKAPYRSDYALATSTYSSSRDILKTREENDEVFLRHGLARGAPAQAGREALADALTTTAGFPAQSTPSRTVLECFQVSQPVISPPAQSQSPGGDQEGDVEGSAEEGSCCTVTLMEHKFGNSYGQPFAGKFSPPPCPFNRVTINFTAVSVGRQFDRLALMYLGDVEVWRTSTAEPTVPPGIRWEYHKDMTHFLSLWRQEQKVIFDLGNIVNDVYTGWFNTTLTATFFTVPDADGYLHGASEPADLILPISKMRGSEGIDSRFTLPEDAALVTIPSGGFPRNGKRAVFSISANGQANEEFWWSNTMESTKDTFTEQLDGSLPGLSPWREVQLLIDGRLAGVCWPFPVIFTGGVSPGLHRPIVGIDAFDLREHEIDISPWLPLLCDGEEHTFQLRIAGIDDTEPIVRITEQVNSNWVVTGKIFVWMDEDADAITTGEILAIDALDPIIKTRQQITQDDGGKNETLTYMLGVARRLQVQGRVVTSTSDQTLTWYQNLGYEQDGFLVDKGYGQVNDLKISGEDFISRNSDDEPFYRTLYNYPLYSNSSYYIAPEGNLTLGAHVNQGLSSIIEGSAVHPTGLEPYFANQCMGQFGDDGVPLPSDYDYRGAFLNSQRDGTAWFFRTGDNKNSSGFGSTKQLFVFGAETDMYGKEKLRLYSRDVEAINSTVVRDDQISYNPPRSHMLAQG